MPGERNRRTLLYEAASTSIEKVLSGFVMRGEETVFLDAGVCFGVARLSLPRHGSGAGHGEGDTARGLREAHRRRGVERRSAAVTRDAFCRSARSSAGAADSVKSCVTVRPARTVTGASTGV